MNIKKPFYQELFLLNEQYLKSYQNHLTLSLGEIQMNYPKGFPWCRLHIYLKKDKKFINAFVNSPWDRDLRAYDVSPLLSVKWKTGWF
jgi:hypothetical protein